MPDERRAERQLTEAAAKEVIEHLDKVCELLGQETFTKQIEKMQAAILRNRQQITESTAMTGKDIDTVIDVLPMMLSETVGQAFSTLTASMDQVLSDPEKLKAAVQSSN